ncbi:MAG TPA: branched-chain amino acid ABC transporter substrate-binding protein [Alphaproteobacteria bacterium]|nr:branched-chain amino acid ABC transporter substrate-binding protein [Alphaproteobacteria bacterium]
MTRSICWNRLAVAIATSAMSAAFGLFAPAGAADKTVAIGIELPLTGGDAELATTMKDGAMLAIDDANAAGGVAGYKLDAAVLDSGTATTGQYDPAQAAVNARKLASDSKVVAIVGPATSGEAKAMLPILSEANLAAITMSATNPDLTDPKFAGQFRPKGKAVFFRMVATDAYQGPNMANYFKDVLHVKSVYVLDDGGAYGVGLADAFEGQAKKIGIKVLGRDQLNPKEADYTTVLTKIKGMGPDGLYVGGNAVATVKLAKQAYEVIPNAVKGGGDGLVGGDFLKGVGFPAADGWYATVPSPHVTDDPAIQEWANRFTARYKKPPEDYSITSHDAAFVIIDAIKRVAASGKEVNRDTVRDAIQSTNLKTLQGEVAFDANGDMVTKVISAYQVKHDPKYPDGDVTHQFKYVGVTPASASN